MTRLCERPGCSQVAEMTYGFDADQLMVWIDSFDRVMPGHAGVLCCRHADAMVVPLGWMLDDRRDAVPRLFKAPAQAIAVVPRPRRRPTQRHDDAEQLELGADVDDVIGEGGETSAPVVADVAPWKPTFDQTDDLDGLLEAHSPLLARAFGGHDRPR